MPENVLTKYRKLNMPAYISVPVATPLLCKLK
jgi:hypothetical protein